MLTPKTGQLTEPLDVVPFARGPYVCVCGPSSWLGGTACPYVHVRHPGDLEEGSVHLHASHVAPTSGHRARPAAL